MHISEGILSTPVLATGAVITLVGLAIGLRKMDNARVPEVAVMSSAFFVASLIRLPLGPMSLHLTLSGLIGMVLGLTAFPAIFVALILQALLFQFGGFTTLGINTTIMALPALAAYLLSAGVLKSKLKHAPALAGFIAGCVGAGLGTIFLAVALLETEQSFLNLIKMLFLWQVPVILLEGAVTAFVATFLMKVRPEMLSAIKKSIKANKC